MRETPETQDQTQKSVQWLPIGSIAPRCAVQDTADVEKIRELTDSIREDGLISPITVRMCGRDAYVVVNGDKRLAACKKCGMERIDAVVLPQSEDNAQARRVLEAIGSGHMHYLDEAEALCALRDGEHMTEAALACTLDKPEREVRDRMRLMELDEDIRQRLRREQLPERAAQAICSVPGGETRSAVLNMAARDKLGVRDIGLLCASGARMATGAERQGPKAVAVVRDARLYVNALRSIVRQMQESGLAAELSESETLSQMELVVRIPQKKRRMIRCHQQHMMMERAQ